MKQSIYLYFIEPDIVRSATLDQSEIRYSEVLRVWIKKKSISDSDKKSSFWLNETNFILQK